MATPGVKVSPTAPKRQLYWRNILFLSSTALFAILVTPYYLYETGMTWGLFFLWAISSAMTSLSITAGYHRYLSHRSYDARAAVKIGYLLFGAAAFQGSALQWAADHRRHHRLVDTDDDPHNINEGFFHAHMGWLFRKEDPRFAKRFPPDLLKDKLVMWQAKHYEWIAISMGFVLPTLIGWSMGSPFGGLLFGGVLRVVFTNHSTFFINSLAHTLGRRTYNSQQTARDSVVMALLAFGEGYHNFHHAFAADYRNGIRWYHYDPTKWVIKLLSLCGMTYRLKIVPASEILRVRLQNEQRLLIERGASEDRIQAMKLKVEEAQRRWRQLGEDYKRFKVELRQQVESTSQRRLIHLKAEVRVAKLEFKMAWAQWGVYRRTMLAVR